MIKCETCGFISSRPKPLRKAIKGQFEACPYCISTKIEAYLIDDNTERGKQILTSIKQCEKLQNTVIKELFQVIRWPRIAKLNKKGREQFSKCHTEIMNLQQQIFKPN